MESEFTEEEREELDSILAEHERSYILTAYKNPVLEAANKKFENQFQREDFGSNIFVWQRS